MSVVTSSRHQPLLRALRPEQWLKNLLVFAPPFLAHDILDTAVLLRGGVAFISFSFLASGGYLLNDILDLEDDRGHPIKRLRPLASGALTVRRGVIAIPILFSMSFGLAFLLPPGFLGTLALYFVTTTIYSWRLKRAAIVDVLVLAGLYTLRIVAGGTATDTPISFWLLAFSMFLFLSLAMVKRYAELSNLRARGEEHSPGRSYQAGDMEALAQFGSSSGYLSVLVLALYINSDSVRVLYSNPPILWLLCPLLLYLVSRIWLLARRGEVLEDPLVFVLEDRRTYLVAALGGMLLWLAA